MREGAPEQLEAEHERVLERVRALLARLPEDEQAVKHVLAQEFVHRATGNRYSASLHAKVSVCAARPPPKSRSRKCFSTAS